MSVVSDLEDFGIERLAQGLVLINFHKWKDEGIGYFKRRITG